ncbi:hypothetical protein D3C71_23710 [compost metagenome]
MVSVSPELRARMQRCSEALAAAGAKGIYFTAVPPQDGSVSAERLADDLCAVVEGYLEGRLRPFQGVGDRNLAVA